MIIQFANILQYDHSLENTKPDRYNYRLHLTIVKPRAAYIVTYSTFES